jgi:hypothetical protein
VNWLIFAMFVCSLHFRQYTSISFWGLGHSLRKPSQPTLLAGGHSWLVNSSLERERDMKFVVHIYLEYYFLTYTIP